MKKFKYPTLILVIILDFILLLKIVVGNSHVPLLNPMGTIALQQRNLAFAAIGIMLIVAIPLLSAFYVTAFRYRSGNNKTNNTPIATRHKNITEILWWLIPTVFILMLSFITWTGTHKLDPYKPLVSDVKPIRIHVVALQWKWLFLYPDYNVAMVNFIQFPKNTPINFELTADAPMNSFWIPALSGQIYAMTGMSTKLHLQADSVGDFPGVAAEINGRGFSGMKFIARATTRQEFDQWITDVKKSSKTLTYDEYEVIARPSEKNEVVYYSSYEDNLYNKIMMKYTHGGSGHKSASETNHSTH